MEVLVCVRNIWITKTLGHRCHVIQNHIDVYPYTNLVTCFYHILKLFLISKSTVNFVWYRLIHFVPWSVFQHNRCDYGRNLRKYKTLTLYFFTCDAYLALQRIGSIRFDWKWYDIFIFYNYIFYNIYNLQKRDWQIYYLIL